MSAKRHGKSTIMTVSKHPRMDEIDGLVCAIWETLGSNPNYAKDHKITKPYRHPGDNVSIYNEYLSVSGYRFNLEAESYMCSGCYQDAYKNASTEKKQRPRWLSKHFPKPALNKHCQVCHKETIIESNSCPCHMATQWIPPETWSFGLGYKIWQEYFKITRKCDIDLQHSSLCKAHYMEIYHTHQKKKCACCEKSDGQSWEFLGNLKLLLHEYLTSQSMGRLLLDTDWICAKCKSDVHKWQKNRDKLNKTRQDDHGITILIMSHTAQMVKAVKAEGFTMRKSVVNGFKDCLSPNMQDTERYCKQFENYLTNYIQTSADIGSFVGQNRCAGALLYDNNKFNSQNIQYVYNLIQSKDSLQKEVTELLGSTLTIRDIQSMIDQQVDNFLDGQVNVDYRKVLETSQSSGATYMLEQYLNPKLVAFLEQVLDMKSGSQGESIYTYSQKLKLHTVIAVLCNIKHPKSIMLQTMLAFVAYANGLRDKGFDILNSFGIICGIKFIRDEAIRWSNTRKCTDELDKTSFWRVTFDNLNFRRKFAKTFKVGGEVLGRMLNLITGQVTHREISSSPGANSPVNQTPGVNFTPSLEVSPFQTLSEGDFFLHESSDGKSALSNYLGSLICAEKSRLGKDPGELKSTLLLSLQNYLPHYTPASSDRVVYTTVMSAQAASINDVSQYLQKMKEDLCVGQPDYPKQVVLGGDQQTYALMKNLKKKFPISFEWILPVPGDWHLLKCASETLRDMLWDGGLQQLAKSCRHMKEITQWRDVHNMLTAVHEALLHEAMSTQSIFSADELQSWISTDNADEMSRFWTQTLYFLNAYVGYYLSIRTGNFALRNACLVPLAELFFAYSHNKYEELVCETIKDVLHLPSEVQNHFNEGEWTISLTGKPFHNVALDEGHEQVVNKQLKELTTRPSEFRTVTLANFMAFLDKFIGLFYTVVLRYRKHRTNKETSRYEYVQVVLAEIKKHNIFASQERSLYNTFDPKAKDLDNETRYDLLRVQVEGRERMIQYIRQHAIHPPLDIPQKRRRTKLKTFTKKKQTARTQKTVTGQLSLLLKRAYSQLQKTGLYLEKTIEFPLALCSEFGDMRPRHKSKMKDVMQAEFPGMFSTCLPFIPPENDTEIIIDFLKYIHSPTPPDIKTHSDLATYYWKQVIMKIGFRPLVNSVTVVIDKPEHLPLIRKLLHSERKLKTGGGNIQFDKFVISNDEPVFHGSNHVAALQEPTYKKG